MVIIVLLEGQLPSPSTKTELVDLSHSFPCLLGPLFEEVISLVVHDLGHRFWAANATHRSDDSGTDHKCREVFNFNLPNSLCPSRSQPVQTNFNQSCWWKSELQSILSSMPNSSMSSTSTCHGSHEFAYSWPSSHILRAELHGLLDAVGTQSSSHTTWS